MKKFSLSLLKCLLVGLGLQSAILAAPANDSFSAPTVVIGFPATATGSNVDATLQVDEPQPTVSGTGPINYGEASVWFTWTSPMTGSVQIDTLGSDFDTILAVWTGSTLATLSEIDSNDYYDGPQSAIFIDVVQGTTYRIAIYGYQDARGQAGLSIKNDTTSRISGIVTGPDGFTSLAGISAIASYKVGEGPSAYWSSLYFGTTGNDGAYTIRGLRSDNYRIEFLDFENGNYQTEYYDNVPEVDSAVDIVVAGNTMVTGINASLELASRITGTVTGPDGTTPLSGILVFAYRFNPASNSWDYSSASSTLPDGTYRLGSLSPGTYRLEFNNFNTSFLDEYYDNAASLSSATSIIVAANTTVPNINASLRLAPKITGSVTGPNGTTPLAGITVTAYRLYDSANSFWYPIHSVTTAADGSYQLNNLQFGGLPGGPYRVGFSDPSGSYAREFYSNAVDVVLATSIVIAENTTASGIDASMTLASKITGTITGPNGTTPLAGIEVRAYLSTRSWETVSTAMTQANGSYQLGGLTAGTYQIGFSDPDGNYIAEYHNNATSVFSATSITVGETTTVSGFNASLALASKITGTVTGPNGTTPLGGISVAIYQSTVPYSQLGSAMTQADGSYQLGGLVAGDYRIGFRDTNGNHITEYHQDALEVNSATNVTVPAGATVNGIDASLVLPTLPEVLGFRKTGPTSFEMSFTGTPGNLYWLQESTSLTSWRNIGAFPFTCQHGVNLRTVTSSEPKVFWRLKSYP
ncbi:MAG: hypothetical protein ACRCXD_07190 [Luteolibacter sp.]